MISTTSNVVPLHDHAPTSALAFRRSLEEIRRDIASEDKRHSERMRVLTDELAGMAGAPSGAPPVERRLCKKAAAAELGIKPERLMRLISRYHFKHPDRLPIAAQPGGKNANWEILVDRVAMVMRGEQTPTV